MECRKCGHIWLRKTKYPKACPRCRSKNIERMSNTIYKYVSARKERICTECGDKIDIGEKYKIFVDKPLENRKLICCVCDEINRVLGMSDDYLTFIKHHNQYSPNEVWDINKDFILMGPKSLGNLNKLSDRAINKLL